MIIKILLNLLIFLIIKLLITMFKKMKKQAELKKIQTKFRFDEKQKTE